MKLKSMRLESLVYRLLGVSPAKRVEASLIGMAYAEAQEFPYKVQELVDSLVDNPTAVGALREIARRNNPEIYTKVNWSTPRRR